MSVPVRLHSTDDNRVWGRGAPLPVPHRTESERSEKAPARHTGRGPLLCRPADQEDAKLRFRTIGEGDECTCPQMPLPEWLSRIDERAGEAAEGNRLR